MRGTVVRVLPGKGYAFIRDPEGANRFAHARSFTNMIDFDRLYEGAPVEFDPEFDPKGKGNGLSAINVKLCSSSNGQSSH